MSIDKQQLNKVATNAALIKLAIETLDENLRQIADYAEALAKAANEAANELVRP